MKENKIVIEINCPVSRAFNFTIDPYKTPSWIDYIVREEASESPAIVGTTYKNIARDGKRSEYEVVKIERNKIFELKQRGSSYHVRYTYEQISDSKTRLTYFEWVDNGKLESPLSLPVLEKLKKFLENSA